jgi:hypothetical protein
MPWSRLLEKLIVIQLAKKLPAFYGIQMFSTVFTRAHLWTLSWANWIHTTLSCPVSLKSILILFPICILSLPSGLFL